jgi:uncharacterized membrane protein HdeD (DUF308 family)
MEQFVETLSKRWWLVVLRGVLAVIFGVTAWAWPGLTLTTLVVMVGAYVLASGMLSFAGMFFAREDGESIWPYLLDGLLGLFTGIMVLAWPGISTLALLYLIAAWAVASGIFQIAGAIELRKEIEGEWLMGIAGAGSILFGVLTAIFPGDGALALVWTIGLYSVVIGIVFIVLGFRLHGGERRLTTAPA